ncbi:hypothetical protein SUGI_0808600 [Cryptomeria japonica]|uniref:abscisic acid 8'-hydroxylase 1 n=1 Tax=Cryptomeria japonica TaxID=3369 RepID=UPI002414CEC1|nr:abscisic acid 8'-hydroxylase 1 [Cryptomeria japonica]GLJ39575.1 hypothetical protein SUGI_0808600 [Cryptomeria japonica]
MIFLLAILIIVGGCMVVRLWYHLVFFSRGSRLPPGSMGWPYIGQTLQLYSQNPDFFFSSKQKRYGDIFKTRVLGCPCIMIANPEAVRFVLVQKAQIFKPTFPASKERMLGRNALFFQEGEYHARLRKLVQSSFLPEAIRGIVPDIDKIAQNILKTWEGRTISTFQEMKKYAFDVGLHSIFGPLDSAHHEALKKYYHILEKGYNSLPVNLPGTLFNKSIKARKKLGQILSKIIAERRAQNAHHKDFLESLMASRDEKGQTLNEEQIADNVIGVLFAAQDTTASVLTWLVKFLAEYPALLDAVIAEQDAVGGSKVEESLTIADTKKMLLTTRVIQETLRVATVLSFTFREAVEDVEYKGFLIPKGWKVLPLFRNIHHNPEFFPDPQHFDPSRFLVPPKPNTFLPFGNGVHSCPGNQLAYTEMFILIHHLTTKYRWQLVGTESGIEYGPFPLPKQGLPVRLIPR